jgi:hypothetical protein
MANSKAATRKRMSERVLTTPLGPGIHAATVELGLGSRYRVRLLQGDKARATLAPGVSPALIDECRRTRRPVLLSDGEQGPVILGALQTAPALHVNEKTGRLEVEAEHIALNAGATIELRVGPASLALSKSGVARIEGDRMVIDVNALLRVLSAKVELP